MNDNVLWSKYLEKNKYINKIKNDINTDILIIGGGIAGLTVAYFLKDYNYNITLIDKNIIGNGITIKTTAKVTYLQKNIYSILKKNFNKDISRLYLNSQLEAMQLMLNIIKKENIECDIEKCDSYIFTKNKNNIKAIEDEKKLLDEFNIDNYIDNSLPIENFKIEKSLKVPNTYTINPIKYINGIKNSIKDSINIYENTLAKNISIKDNRIITETNNNKINSKYVIVCCHYPFFIFPGLIPVKTYIKREYVNCAEFNVNKNFTAINIDKNLHSVRFYKNYVIYGSNSHKLTNKIDYEKNYNKSKSDFKRIFSREPELTWMNQDIMTNDNLPLIGKIKNNIFIATGFNAWGMTNATIAGKIIKDLIIDKKNIYEKMFSPKRSNITNTVNSLIRSLNYAKVYIQTTIKRNPTFYNEHVYTIKINGKYYGIYYDLYNKRHIVSLTCPHMKCHLVFNNYEKTWDCPCHGSRFDIDGNIINGPSKENIKKF